MFPYDEHMTDYNTSHKSMRWAHILGTFHYFAYDATHSELPSTRFKITCQNQGFIKENGWGYENKY